MNTKRDLSKLDPIPHKDSHPTSINFIPSSPPNKRPGLSTVRSGFIKTSPLQTSLDLTVSIPKMTKLEPLYSPKDKVKQKLSLNLQLSNGGLKTKAETTRIPSPRGSLDLSDFMAGLYKKPIEKSEDNVKSFVSFRTIAYNNAKSPKNFKTEEAFLPPPQNEDWKTQLELNKKRETLFKQTLNDMFMQSNQQFYKLAKHREVQEKRMPNVKVYTTSANAFPGDRNVKPIVKKTFDVEVITHKLFQNPDKPPEFASRVRVSKDEPFKFYLYPVTESSSSLRKPHSREGHSMNAIGKCIYLYGGVSREIYNEWEVLDTSTYTWSKLEAKGDVPTFGRFGHSGERYQNGIVIFGGEKNYNSILKIRECLNDVRMFIPEQCEWKYLKGHGDLVEPRRNHAAVIVGKHMLIHGGIDNKGMYLNDLMIFNLNTYKWQVADERNAEHTGIAFHKACPVFGSHHKELNIFKMVDLKLDNGTQYIKEEGVYFFGGRNHVEEPLNTLRILKLGTLIFKWITPVTQGITPDPRFMHSMVHCKKLNMLIVSGGRSDGYTADYAYRNPFLSDLHILQLENLLWTRVTISGPAQQTPRCSHAATVIGSKMIILGGIHYNVYCPPDHLIYEMDPPLVRNLERKHEHKQSQSRDFFNGDELHELRRNTKAKQTVVSFLPMPKDDSPRKLRQVSKRDFDEAPSPDDDDY